MPNRALVVAALLAIVSHADAEQSPAGPKLVVEYTPPTTRGVIGIPADHVAQMRVLVSMLETQLKLPNKVTISYRECGTANAFYYPSSHSIEICHELWDKRRRLYTRSGMPKDQIDQRLRAALTFSFFHEFGHALHDELDLPLLGREEDAVDDIATIFMLRLGVGDAAQAAAVGHHLRSQQPNYQITAWDEHAGGAQRGYAIGCLLYGADPERYAPTLTVMNIPAPQMMRCKKDYQMRVKAWNTLFKPHMAQR
jgi:hypothetical protein